MLAGQNPSMTPTAGFVAGRRPTIVLALVAMVVLAALLAPRTALAEDVKEGSLTFRIEGDHATLWAYDGSETHVVVPSVVAGKPVTAIREHSDELFYRGYGSSSESSLERTKLESIEIPGSIASIPARTFDHHQPLKEVKLGAGVKAIGEGCFSHTAIKSLVFPSAMTTVPNSCCYGCDKLETVTLPERVTSFGRDCFTDCKSLTAMTVPATCTKFGEYCLYQCDGLKTLEIKAPNFTAGEGSFYFKGSGKTLYVQNKTMKSYLETMADQQYKEYVSTKKMIWPVINVKSTNVVSRTNTELFSTMFRLYNPNSGEHFYTSNAAERDAVKAAGWTYEGVGWNAPKSGFPVYRLYNENAGDHHYTTSKNERDTLVNLGWKYEGVGWYSGGSKPLYRQYNPNAVSGSHNYTMSKNENDSLVKLGWHAEGIGWYGV